MKKIFEQRFDTTEEERKRVEELKLSVWTVILDLPKDAVVRRINTRILQQLKTVLNQQTREMMQAMVGEECVYMWYEADPEQPLEKRTFYIVSTGGIVPEDSNYVGAFLLQAGAHVFQVYEQQPITTH